MSDTMTVQMPAAAQSTGHTYTALASISFSRPDKVSLQLQTGAIPLSLSAPGPDRQLKVELNADAKGYRLGVTDAQGHKLATPAWGVLSASASRVSTSGPLFDSPEGVWSAQWPDGMGPGSETITVQGWVAARGYPAAAFRQTITVKP